MKLSRELIEDVAAWADGWLSYRHRAAEVPGVQFAIAHHGEIVAHGAHGLADLETKEPLRAHHLFRVASQSKSFTAALLMQLVEENPSEVHLDDRLGQHLSGLERPGLDKIADATLAEMLHHGSGITRDGLDGDYWQLQHAFPDAVGLVRLAEATPSPYPVHDRFHYSNIAYSLLGLVIESLTGRSYADHARERIVEPLDLADTAADYVPAWADRYAAGHSNRPAGRPRVPIDHVATNAMAPATGFTSTAQDMARYFSAHCLGDERLLSDVAKRRMQHTHWRTRGSEGYGFGLQTIEIGERRLIGHSGGYPGHSTQTWCDPRAGVVVSVLANAIGAPAGALCTGIFKLLDRLAKRDTAPAPLGVDLDSFCGQFMNLWSAYDVARFGTGLFVVPLATDDPSESVAELHVEDGNTAILAKTPDGYASEGERFHFDRSGERRPRAVRGYSGMTAYIEPEYEKKFCRTPRVRLGEAAP